MSECKVAFQEVEMRMDELMDKLSIKLEDMSSYPAEDMFRIVVKEIEVENLKLLTSIFNKNELQAVSEQMSPAVSKFMLWWDENLCFGNVDISALIARKEQMLILNSVTDVLTDDDATRHRI